MMIDTACVPETSVSWAPASDVRWLVGLPFGSAAARVVWLYYIVADADSGAEAVQVALERADDEVQEERLAQGQPFEVQRILRDPIGRTSLMSWP